MSKMISFGQMSPATKPSTKKEAKMAKSTPTFHIIVIPLSPTLRKRRKIEHVELVHYLHKFDGIQIGKEAIYVRSEPRQ